MDKITRIFLYGPEALCSSASALLADLPDAAGAQIRATDNWLEFQSGLVEWAPSLTIVLEEGRAAVTAIVIAKRTRQEMPVFWFSEDPEQSIRSHSLECDYFGVKPVTREHLERALMRCSHIGIVF